MKEVSLRNVRDSDIVTFFEHQLDPVARHMAAFTSTAAGDWDAFVERWEKIQSDKSIMSRAIIFEGQVAGNIISFERYGEREVGYWLGREFWGKGIATEALSQFLEELTMRPLHARVAKDNVASRRVLEKCGFKLEREAKSFANARGEETGEYVMRLESND